MKHLVKISLAAFVAMGTMTASAAHDIKVGSAAGVTGPIAELVAPILVGRNLAAAHVNAQGMLLDGHMMKMVLADSACDPKAGVDAGSKLINVEQVVAIVGASCSGATNGLVNSVAIPSGVVALSDSATAPSISDLKDNDLVFRVAPSDAYQGAALAAHVMKSGIRSVAMTYANDDYNAGIAEVFEREYKEMGGTITAVQAHEPNKASYRGEMATLAKGKQKTLVLFAYYGSSGIAIIRNSVENGLFNKFYAADGMFDKSVIEQLGVDVMRGNIDISQSSSDYNDLSYKLFAAHYSATGGDPKAPYAAMGYDATFLIALAIEKAGSADRSKISAALRSVASGPGVKIHPGEWAHAKALIAAGKDINYEGASGNVDFDKNGDVSGIYGINTIGADGKWHNKLIE